MLRAEKGRAKRDRGTSRQKPSNKRNKQTRSAPSLSCSTWPSDHPDCCQKAEPQASQAGGPHVSCRGCSRPPSSRWPATRSARRSAKNCTVHTLHLREKSGRVRWPPGSRHCCAGPSPTDQQHAANCHCRSSLLDFSPGGNLYCTASPPFCQGVHSFLARKFKPQSAENLWSVLK